MVEPALSNEYRAAVLINNQARAKDPDGIGKVLAEKVKRMGAIFHRTAVEALTPLEAGGWQITTAIGVIEACTVVVAATVAQPPQLLAKMPGLRLVCTTPCHL